MSELNMLLTSYSVEQLIIIIVAVLIVCKALLELWRYFYDKFRNYFGMKNRKEEWEHKTTDTLEIVNGKLDNLETAANERKERLIAVENKVNQLEKYSEVTHEQQKELESSMKLVQERLQENTRSFLIDAHHRFCYDVEGIDDLNLQSIERRYLYYKTAGGDSFIDTLMQEIRALPRLTYANNNMTPNDGREIHG